MFIQVETNSCKREELFHISFNVTFGPPTTVNCTVNKNDYNFTVESEVLKYEYEDDEPDISRVTMIITNGGPGLYNCSVRNQKATKDVISTFNLTGNTLKYT